MTWLRRASRLLNRWMLRGASLILVATMGVAVANMFLRPLGRPIQGSFELMGLGGALIAGFALGSTQERRNHIFVDILFERFGQGARRVLDTFSHLACATFFGLAGYRTTRLALDMIRTGEVSETLRVAFYPVTLCVALGLWGLCFTLLVDALDAARPPAERT
ncbi:MAG: TRAP transporter small permease [Proteobacteria bacterium]|nr:TRAP transporter small permease [Pseudomonadota bacterium]